LLEINKQHDFREEEEAGFDSDGSPRRERVNNSKAQEEHPRENLLSSSKDMGEGKDLKHNPSQKLQRKNPKPSLSSSKLCKIT